jgi:hypothetical protein
MFQGEKKEAISQEMSNRAVAGETDADADG